jgi:hypothetical protein
VLREPFKDEFNYTPHSSWKIIVEVEGLQYYFNPERGSGG